MSLSYVFQGFFLVTTSIFNGLQQTQISLKISLIKAILFTAPLAFVGSHWGVTGIFTGVAFANLLGGMYASYQMKKDLKRVNSGLLNKSISREYITNIKAKTI